MPAGLGVVVLGVGGRRGRWGTLGNIRLLYAGDGGGAASQTGGTRTGV